MGQVQAVWHTCCILTRSPTVLVHVREDHLKEHKPSELLYTPFPLSSATFPPQESLEGAAYSLGVVSYSLGVVS